ncbi:protein HGH1 homolog [Oppia nitens]|uniref:protein HGH1 homolog n=1 Tax=Oppia nitens TaxID=1686743 RepID=UPI0023DA8940|nr:protein HGH1 homolog [Oppia nitens]
MSAKVIKSNKSVEFVIKEIMSTTDDKKREKFIVDNKQTIAPMVKLFAQTVTSGGGDHPTAQLALNCILVVSCAATECRLEPILCEAIINETTFILHMISDIICGHYNDHYFGILVNLTRYDSTVQQIYKLCPKDFLNKLFTILLTNSLVSALITNLSQIEDVRQTIVSDPSLMSQLFDVFDKSDSINVKNAITCIVRNCCFDNDLHQILLKPQNDLLVKLVLPIAGPEELSEEDNNKLPIDLQYLGSDKCREKDPEIRKLLMEAMLMLCSTRFGRQVIRESNVYLILREYHKWEKVREVQKAIEDVVDIIIKTEEEIDTDDLKAIDIPDDLIQRFNQMDKELIKEDDDKDND